MTIDTRSDETIRARTRIARLLVGGLVVLYAAGYLFWYSATPLGLHPVLDGREILLLAEQMAMGSLPAEPFYRAPLYPALLALLIDSGLALPDPAFAARVLNFLLHCVSTALVGLLALHLWRRELAALLAAALFGLNPVVLHFVGDPLDITLAITLMLGGTYAALRAAADDRALGCSALAGVLHALATLARPQLIVLFAGWSFWLLTRHCGWGSRVLGLGVALVPAMLVFLSMGAINHALSGRFLVLPWQGAFNLWAANHRGADGRYFEQTTRIASYVEGVNPARLEAERLYRARQPGQPEDWATTARYWRHAALTEVQADPLAWLGLLIRKTWYLLNNFEQYNNKTYAVHKARSPWLAPNPLCWGLLIGLAVCGWLQLADRASARLLALLVMAYAGGLLLSYVSARFRLPLVPLAAALGGGVACARLKTAPFALAAGALVAGLALLPLPAADRERTFVQDHLLLARAALESGATEEAEAHARTALGLVPGHGAALEIVCVARFNAWTHSAQRSDTLGPVVSACTPSAVESPVASRVLGISAWRDGRDDEARWRLTTLAQQPGPERAAARAALIMIGASDPGMADAGDCRRETCAEVLLVARAAHGDAAAYTRLSEHLSSAEIERQIDAMRRTFQR
jgi:hypothetical protein